MQIGTIISLTIAAIGMIISLIFSIIAVVRNRRNDSTQEGENKGVIMSDIGYIKAGVDDLKREQRGIHSTLSEHNERITRCEESCKQAHHRIDELKMEEQK